MAQTIKISHQSGFFRYYLKNVSQLLKQLEPDAIILTGWQMMPLLQILFASKSLGIPCIVRGDSNGIKTRQPWIKLIHRSFLQFYDAFLVVGNANHRFYINNGITGDKLFSCPHFVDNERFCKATTLIKSKKEELRRKWNIPLKAVCFCYVGKLEEKKRILDVLEALKLIVTNKINFPIHLLVVGTGELMERAKSFASIHQLPVTFAGFLNQTEIPQAYVTSDCLVLPSDYGETWGLVVNEAMACGLPAIVSDRVGCSLDLIESGKTGETFPFGNSHALSTILSDLVSNPILLKKMGEYANRLVIENYSITKAVQGTLEAIQFVAKPNY